MHGGTFRFTVMGPIRAWLGDAELPLGSPQQRALLALLLIRTQQTVPLNEIATFLWRDKPPSSAANVVHHHVSALRRLLEPELRPREPGRWLLRGNSGYRLNVDRRCVDLHVFHDLTGRARERSANGQYREAAALYWEALALRQGSVGTGSPLDLIDSPVFAEVENDYAKTVVEAAETHLGTGDGQRIAGVMRQTAERYPWDERLQATLIRILGATGRQAEALSVYQTVRSRLSTELGIEPGPALRAAQTAVLRQSANAAPDEGTDSVPAAAGGRPAQLPPDLPSFTGREAGLTQILTASARQSTPVVTTISGMAGVGKTALAVHAAHRVAARFPDGQLFLNLHGFDSGEPMTPDDALRHLLESLGVATAQLPATLPGLTGLYRSLLADRRVIVVLDNSLDAQQVRPLLPATPGSMAIVTSRNVLAGLVITNSAEPVTIAELSPEESHAVLERHFGAARVAHECAAVAVIIEACAGLPIALALVVARAALNTGRSLSEIAAELTSAENRIEAFFSADPDMDLGFLLSCSYRRLDEETARLFRRLALRPTSPISVETAAALSDVPVSCCRRLLANLVAVCLLSEPSAGGFRMHRFVSDYAREALHRVDSPAEQAAAVARVADRHLPNPCAAVIPLTTPPDGRPGPSSLPTVVAR
jgi:DNA-binding SARP family transcriptional activator